MRLLKKLAIKFATMAIMVVLVGALVRHARPYIMKTAGVPEGMPGVESLGTPHFGSEESDLMATVFKSALRLFTGQAKRDELASELSDKLYAGRGGADSMSELGIELEKPGAKPPAAAAGLVKPGAGADSSASAGQANGANSQPGAKLPAKQDAQTAESPVKKASNAVRDTFLARIADKAKMNPELTLIPIVIVGMFVVHLFRRRRSPADDFVLPDLSTLIPTDVEGYQMKHPVDSLPAEDFELLVGLIYQRKGYRVSMPAGRNGGGCGGDFTVARKSERLLVQCKKLDPDYKVPIERVRELHEAALTAGVTRGVFVATCGFSWDARNFAKTKGMTLVNAQTLDTLLTGAREKPDEDFLAISEWAPKLMKKVKLTPPLCPACEAAMDELSVSNGSVWVCSERPECRGRRSARNFHKSEPAASKAKPKTTPSRETSKAEPQTAPRREKVKKPVIPGGRARTVSPSPAARR